MRKGTLGRKDSNKPGYGVALVRQARMVERIGMGVPVLSVIVMGVLFLWGGSGGYSCGGR